MRFKRGLLLLALPALSCFEPELVDGEFTCAEPPHACPEEFVCQADCVCRSPDSEPPAGSPTDCAEIE